MRRAARILSVLGLLCAAGSVPQPAGVGARPPAGGATAYYVSTAGDDSNPGTAALPWRTIQHAANTAGPGSTVAIAAGVYNEKVVIGVSGTEQEGFVEFRGPAGGGAVLDGTGIAGDELILLHDRSYVRIAGLELRNNLQQTFGAGIRVTGAGRGIEISANLIHDMRAAPGGDAMAVAVYGTDPAVPLSDIVVSGNTVYDCEPGRSEALTLNGNVDGFLVQGNVIRDVDNIGIDMIGGEGTCPTPALDAARNGVCRGNTVLRARSGYGGGYAAGIYVDGGRDILVEGNTVSECDLGIEVGCENRGFVSSGIVVRNNAVYRNDKGGLVFGGYRYPSTGKVIGSVFRNNTVFTNDLLGTGTGELWIQQAEGCTVTGNILHSSGANRLMTTTVGSAAGNIIDYNIWFAPGGAGAATVDWHGDVHSSFDDYRAATGNDAHSTFADPLLVSAAAADIRLLPASPAIDAADPSILPDSGETDILGGGRLLGGAMDAGAVERAPDEPEGPPPPALLGAFRNASNVRFVWSAAEGADLYAVQLSEDPEFPVEARLDTALADTALDLDLPSDGGVRHWRVRSSGPGGAGGWSPSWSIALTSGNVSIEMADRWNLVSLPADPFDPRRTALFPSAVSPAYAYTGSYAEADSLRPGAGYWIRFNGRQTARFGGAASDPETAAVAPGWNLVGAPSVPASAGDVEAIGTAILTPFYRYDGVYRRTDTLLPGSGHWVKVNAHGALVLHPAPSKGGGR